MIHCPCCSTPMTQHIRLHETYWFCRHCWQEMPNLNSEKSKRMSYLAGIIPSEKIALGIKEKLLLPH